MRKPTTSLGLILNRVGDEPVAPRLEKPDIITPAALTLWEKPAINPTKMRKGKSGEIDNQGRRGK